MDRVRWAAAVTAVLTVSSCAFGDPTVPSATPVNASAQCLAEWCSTVEPFRCADASTGGAVNVDPLCRGTWIIDEEWDEVSLVAPGGAVTRIPVGAWPEQLLVDRTGRVYVSAREEGIVTIIEPDFSVRAVLVGSEPRALALDDDANRLYVGLVTERAVVAIDTRTLAMVGRKDLDSEPHALALTDDGVVVLSRKSDTLDVLPRGLCDLPARRIALGKGRGRSWHGQALVAANRALVVVHSDVQTGEAPTRGKSIRFEGGLVFGVGIRSGLGRGGGGGYGNPSNSDSIPNRTLVSVIRGGKAVDLTPESMTVPFSVDVTGAAWRDGVLVMASRGTRSIVAVALDPDSPESGVGVPTVAEVGSGVAGVAVDSAGRLTAWAPFARTLHTTQGWAETARMKIIGRRPGRRQLASSFAAVTLHPGRLDPGLALGRSLYFQADHASVSAGGLSCAVCHPDGREDGLVWSLDDDRRQTPLLAGRLHGTAPFGWLGEHERLEDNISSTIRRIGGVGIMAHELAALGRWLREGLRPVMKPTPVPSQEALVALGERLFNDSSTGCGDCHPTDANTSDGLRHDVGTGTRIGRKKRVPMDTPSLRHVALTAPYFHDGSAPTLESLFTHETSQMGDVSGLSADERRALIAYLETL